MPTIVFGGVIRLQIWFGPLPALRKAPLSTRLDPDRSGLIVPCYHHSRQEILSLTGADNTSIMALADADDVVNRDDMKKSCPEKKEWGWGGCPDELHCGPIGQSIDAAKRRTLLTRSLPLRTQPYFFTVANKRIGRCLASSKILPKLGHHIGLDAFEF